VTKVTMAGDLYCDQCSERKVTDGSV